MSKEKMSRVMQVEMRKELVLSHAIKLFCMQGIEDTSIQQIAKETGLGPASIYRYFDTKADLAIASAILYWNKLAEKYKLIFDNEAYQQKSGIEQMQDIIALMIEIYDNDRTFFKFLTEFDIFVRKYQISPERLETYECQILRLKDYVTDALKKGIDDQTIAFEGSIDELYFTITHTMMSLMQKLSLHHNILTSDKMMDELLKLKLLGEIIIRGIRK